VAVGGKVFDLVCRNSRLGEAVSVEPRTREDVIDVMGLREIETWIERG
jgi:hypothetical protein